MNLRDFFVELTKQSFEYLEDDFGFVLISTNAPFVIYDSAELRVYIYFDPERRGELDASIERLSDVGKKKPCVGISELISLEYPDDEVYESPYPSTVEDLRREVPRLAHLLREYGAKLLRQGLSEMERLEELRYRKEQEILASMRKAREAD